MKKYFSLFLAFVSCMGIFYQVFAATTLTKEEKTLGYNQYTTGDYSYTNNVTNLCLGKRYGGDYWNFDTSKQLVIEHNKTKYPDLAKTGGGISFDDINKIYRSTMDQIMNCAILKSKYTLHKKIIDDYKVSDKSKKILQEANTKLEKQIQEQKCIAPRDGDKIYNSKDLLDSMSYEQCVYHMYIFYYGKVCDTNLGSCLSGKKVQTAVEAAETIGTEKNKLKNEQEIADRALDTALEMYENFERTYIAHVLLQLIEVELTQDKRFVGVTMKALMQWTSLAKNAQKNT